MTTARSRVKFDSKLNKKIPETKAKCWANEHELWKRVQGSFHLSLLVIFFNNQIMLQATQKNIIIKGSIIIAELNVWDCLDLFFFFSFLFPCVALVNQKCAFDTSRKFRFFMCASLESFGGFNKLSLWFTRNTQFFSRMIMCRFLSSLQHNHVLLFQNKNLIQTFRYTAANCFQHDFWAILDQFQHTITLSTSSLVNKQLSNVKVSLTLVFGKHSMAQ